MARIARVIAPGIPHHVTQRGNRRQQTFFCDDDYQAYSDLMADWCKKYHGRAIRGQADYRDRELLYVACPLIALRKTEAQPFGGSRLELVGGFSVKFESQR